VHGRLCDLAVGSRLVAEPWSAGRGPKVVTGFTDHVTLVEGVTFSISGGSGDMRGGSHGLFYRDTRFLSHFSLDVDGQNLEPLSTHVPEPYTGEFVSRRPPRVGTADSTLMVVRRRYVGNGMLEEILIHNLGHEAAGVAVRLTVESDFAGLFEVKEDRVPPREGIKCSLEEGAMRFAYRSGADTREVVVSATNDPAVSEGVFNWQAVVAPRSRWHASIEVVPISDGVEAPRR
jgi:glycogen debranching enzyme